MPLLVARIALIVLIVLGLLGVAPTPAARANDPFDRRDPGPVSRLAFGSCNKVDRPQPLWTPIAAARPDVWIWTGDIVYADTDDAAVFARHYDRQRAQPGYAALRRRARILGVWDDHDYGKNNGGREFTGRDVAKRALLRFLDEPDDSPRRRRAGVEAAYVFGPAGRRVAVVLLDVRYYREAPGEDADPLGAAQWAWLERVLRGAASAGARLTLIVSGIQVIAGDHPYEKWANFPRARQRLFRLLATTRTPGAVFITGDRHIAELSALPDAPTGYPLYDLTSSGLTHAWSDHPGEPNRRRVGRVFTGLNFGVVAIDWDAGRAALQVRDRDGATRIEQRLELARLLPPAR